MKKIAAIIIMFTIFCNTAIYAEELEEPKLTVEQAVKDAVKYSRTLKNLAESTTLNEERASELKERYYQTTDLGAIIDSLVDMEKNEFLLSVNNVNTELEKQQLEYDVMEFFSSIMAAERALLLYDEALVLSEKELEITRAKSEMGLVSPVDLQTAEAEYVQSVSERAARVKNIDDAYILLNNLMNKPVTNRYKLVLDAYYEPLEGIDLSRVIRNAQTNDITVKELEHDIRMINYQIESYTEYYSSKSRNEYEIELAKAQRELEDVKRNLEQDITAAYNEILELEASYDIQLITIENMKKQYEIDIVKHELGKITGLALLESEYKIRQSEEELLKLTYNHWIKYYEFKRYL